MNRQDLPWLWANILCYSLGQVAIFSTSNFLGHVVDDLTSHSGKTAMAVTSLFICVVLHEAFYRLGHICEIKILSRVKRNTKQALFAHTHSLSFGYFAERFAGEIAHKVVSTADAFERMVRVTTNNFFEYGIMLPLSIVAFASVNVYYAAFVSIWSVLLLAGALWLSGEMNRRSAAYAVEEARTTGAIVDVYGNISAVKVYGSEDDLDRNRKRIDEETRAFVRLGWWDILTFNFAGIMMIFLSAGLIAMSPALYSSGAVTIGGLVFLATAALRLSNAAWEAGPGVAEFVRSRGEVLQNLKDLIVAPAVVDGDRVDGKGHQKQRVTVEYSKVSFGYIQERPVLDQFSITIASRERVGIVGLSGSGKTTFANLLLRFFDPQRGSILINGQDIRGMTQEALRSHISYISQETSLFHASVAENIAYGSNSASPEDVKTAAVLAHADDFIQRLPNGYGTVVGDRGIKLSGGQRQRIAIARAILSDRPVFLLDEATSALDSESEAKIQKGLEALMESKTVIAIAHRLSTLSRMNRIVFLEDGKIVEGGAHEELLAKNGKYAKLWRMQAGGFLPAAAQW
ncbi:MAG TPA: ABC transporter ATP-binding protein [Terriglobales bacterium]|nr:ABC transporter ATP-binding protein [Terriglobales bacterium]